MTQQQLEVANPYWDEVSPHVLECQWSWDAGHYEVGSPLKGAGSLDFGSVSPPEDWVNVWEKRYELVAKYAWTITDPGTLMFVESFSTGKMVDPMAGTGYWAYLLAQVDVDVVCYDIDPGGNHWHKDNPLHMPVQKMDGAQAVKLHPDRALLLAWPPYNQPDGHNVLRAYKGDRVVFIGESEGGCTGCEDMHYLLNSEWNPVASHRPVQWFGVHDIVTVYDRIGGGRNGAAVLRGQ